VARLVFHNDNSRLGPNDIRDDEGEVAEAGEVGACTGNVFTLKFEVEFLREGSLDFVREPGERIFREEVADVGEGKAG
jgi:hypothetical protein